jgi:hypothetical protein
MWCANSSDSDIVKIAESIKTANPLNVDISGGDPSLVAYETHQKVFQILKKDSPAICKVLLNPKSLL